MARGLIEKVIDRITVRKGRIIAELRTDPTPIEFPWASKSKNKVDRIEYEPAADRRSQPDPKLIQAVVRASAQRALRWYL